jgi:hypothetical protein
MLVVATDAPLDARDLRRLAARAIFGLARTGSSYSNGSGDFAIAFSTSPEMRSRFNETAARAHTILPTEATSPLFEAALEATEEAVYNALFQAPRYARPTAAPRRSRSSGCAAAQARDDDDLACTVRADRRRAGRPGDLQRRLQHTVHGATTRCAATTWKPQSTDPRRKSSSDPVADGLRCWSRASGSSYGVG